MTGTFCKKGKFGHRTPCAHEGRNLDDAPTNQRLPATHQKLGERHGTDPSSQPLEGTSPADNPDCSVLVSRQWDNKTENCAV